MARTHFKSQRGLGFIKRPGGIRHHDHGSPVGIPFQPTSFFKPSIFLPPTRIANSRHPGIYPQPRFNQHSQGGQPRERTLVLLAPVCGSQKGWPKSSHTGPLGLQYIPFSSILPDGTSYNHCNMYRFPHVGGFNRFGRCLLSRSNSLGIPPLPSVRYFRQNIRFPIPSLWPLSCPMGIQQNY